MPSLASVRSARMEYLGRKEPYMIVGGRHLAELVEAVVEDFATEIDPDEKRYANYASLAPLRADLEEVLDGRIADWRIEQAEAHKIGRAHV